MITTRPLYDAGEMRAADAGAITTLGIPGAVLMERAGVAAAQEILRSYARGAAAVACCPSTGSGSFPGRAGAEAGRTAVPRCPRECDQYEESRVR